MKSQSADRCSARRRKGPGLGWQLGGCLHSLYAQDGGNEIDHCGEAFVGLFVSRGNAPKRLEPAEKVLHEVPPLVFLAIMLRVAGCSGAQRNDRLNVAALQLFAQPTGVKRLVANQGEAIDAGQESVERGDVMPLTRQQHEADQIAESVNEDRSLGGQTAARPANGLILSPPFAPVPC
jgi:hypothetical protein